MNIKYIRSCFLIISLSLLVNSCNIVEYFQQDSFYQIGSEFDHFRFPLIKPYYAIYIADEYGWQIPLQGRPSSRDFYYYLTLQDVRKISVEKGVIMIYTPYRPDVDESVGQKHLYWFVIVPEKVIEMGFDNEEDFIDAIQEYGIEQPLWHTPDDILKEYDKTWCLDWIPTCD